MARARTAKQRAQLKKAQLISARKRKGRGSRLKTAAKIGAVAAGIGAVAYAAHRGHGQIRQHRSGHIRAQARGRIANRATNRAQMQYAESARAARSAARAKEDAIWAMARHALSRPSTRGETRRAAARHKLAMAAKGTKGTRVYAMGTGKPKAPSGWDAIHPNVKRRILRNTRRYNDAHPL